MASWRKPPSCADGVSSDDPEDRGLSERCLLGFSTGPPFQPGGYNNNVQIVQTRDYVMLLLEMNHDVRIVPLDGRPHLPPQLTTWLGDARGRWEGPTLVIESTNFTPKVAAFSARIGASGRSFDDRFDLVGLRFDRPVDAQPEEPLAAAGLEERDHQRANRILRLHPLRVGLRLQIHVRPGYGIVRSQYVARS